jgi:hypothetical protein
VDIAIRYSDSPKVFGAIVVPQRDAILARAGEARFARALATLVHDERDEYTSMRTDTWCRSETVERAVRAVAREMDVDARVLVDETAYHAVRTTVGTLWRVLLTMTGDLTLLRRTPMFYARSYDRGALTGERIEPGRAELVLEGWAGVPELHAIGIAAGVRAVLELAGRADVRVAWRTDGELARFDLTWRV